MSRTRRRGSRVIYGRSNEQNGNLSARTGQACSGAGDTARADKATDCERWHRSTRSRRLRLGTSSYCAFSYVKAFGAIVEKLKYPVIFDGRNIYDPAIAARHGVKVYGVGRGSYETD